MRSCRYQTFYYKTCSLYKTQSGREQTHFTSTYDKRSTIFNNVNKTNVASRKSKSLVFFKSSNIAHNVNRTFKKVQSIFQYFFIKINPIAQLYLLPGCTLAGFTLYVVSAVFEMSINDICQTGHMMSNAQLYRQHITRELNASKCRRASDTGFQ